MSNLPFACKLFFNNSIIPQAPPFIDTSTMFSNVGFSLVIVLKRHYKKIQIELPIVISNVIKDKQ